MTERWLEDRYAVACEVLAEAADIALRFSRERSSLTIEAKGPQDLVSQADREVEAHIRRRLIDAFPEDAFVGEETGTGALRAPSARGSSIPSMGRSRSCWGCPFGACPLRTCVMVSR
jgi:3'-phosphoadenosine 5'-phosphosulfate (PAPS) 3'-phosphatase